MKLKNLVKEVRSRAHFESNAEALAAVKATLQTFSERLSETEAAEMAAQLPKEIGIYLLLNQEMPAAPPSDQGFFKRIALREGVDLSQAVPHTRAVMEALQKCCRPESRTAHRPRFDYFATLLEMAIYGTRWAEIRGILAAQCAA